MDIWKTKKNLDLDKHYCGQIGPLILWFSRQFDEIHIAIKRLGDELVEDDVVSFASTNGNQQESLDWKRWVVGDNCNQISILPIMPDRPIVVRPEVPLKIPKDQEALFFVSIPVWVKIVVFNSGETILCEEPSIILSNIWFGDPMSGELCYSLRSRARRQIVDAEAKPHKAICPVRIQNVAQSQLDVNRFCVNVEYLKIYKGQNQLWTNEVHISFQGEDAASRIDYLQKSPEYEAVDSILSDAKTKWEKTLLKKSLGTFKLLASF